jgi:hypothetical protein
MGMPQRASLDLQDGFTQVGRKVRVPRSTRSCWRVAHGDIDPGLGVGVKETLFG